MRRAEGDVRGALAVFIPESRPHIEFDLVLQKSAQWLQFHTGIGAVGACAAREFCIDNLLVGIHLIVEIILVDRPCAMEIEFHVASYLPS